MAIKRTVLLVLFISSLVMSDAGTAFGMDLTIAPSVPAGSPLSRAHESRQRPLNNVKGIFRAPEKHRRHEKFRKGKITSYSLSSDPANLAFKYGSLSFGRERRLALENGSQGLGSAWGNGISAMPPALPLPIDQGVRQEAGDNPGIAFGCGKKSRLASPEVTACYVHKVDKAWKTQTYVTKGLADSNPGWGGGLAVGYAY